MSRVFWDTNLFVYLLEGSGAQTDRVRDIYLRMMERGDELLTSTMTLGEVLVKPRELRNHDLAQRYEQILLRSARLIPFDLAAAGQYSLIRADRTISPPDAIQLACAASARIDLFITADNRLSRKSVNGIQFVASLERAFL